MHLCRFQPALIATLLVTVLTGCQKTETRPQPGTATAGAASTPAASGSTSAAPAAKAAAPALPEAVRKVLGRWLRSDGTYVLELRDADMSGKVEAYYYNPKSINVSRAIWMQGPAGLQVMV